MRMFLCPMVSMLKSHCSLSSHPSCYIRSMTGGRKLLASLIINLSMLTWLWCLPELTLEPRGRKLSGSGRVSIIPPAEVPADSNVLFITEG